MGDIQSGEKRKKEVGFPGEDERMRVKTPSLWLKCWFETCGLRREGFSIVWSSELKSSGNTVVLITPQFDFYVPPLPTRH